MRRRRRNRVMVAVRHCGCPSVGVGGRRGRQVCQLFCWTTFCNNLLSFSDGGNLSSDELVDGCEFPLPRICFVFNSVSDDSFEPLDN